MKNKTANKKIVITGGHLAPAVGVIPVLQKFNWEIYFLGRKQATEGSSSFSFEYKTIAEERRIKFYDINPGRWQREFSLHTIPSLLRIPISIIKSINIIKNISPKIILTFGSYVGVPAAIAGWLLNIPVILHIQTIMPGRADYLISKFAKKICVSWKETEKYFSKEKVVLTGNPVINDKIPAFAKASAGRQISNKKIIYITGGNQGSQIINKAVAEILPWLTEGFIIYHQCGEIDLDKIKNQKSKIKNIHNYILKANFSFEEAGEIMKKADLVVTRAGVNTIVQLLYLKKPAIIIPIPWSNNNEQESNAIKMKDSQLGIIINQKDLNGQILKQNIELMMENPILPY